MRVKVTVTGDIDSHVDSEGDSESDSSTSTSSSNSSNNLKQKKRANRAKAATQAAAQAPPSSALLPPTPKAGMLQFLTALGFQQCATALAAAGFASTAELSFITPRALKKKCGVLGSHDRSMIGHNQ